MSFRAPTRNPVYAAYTILRHLFFLDSASERGMTVTDRLARSCIFALIGFIFHIPKLAMTHFCQIITFFLKYVSRNSVGEQFFLRLNMRLKLDRLLKPHS